MLKIFFRINENVLIDFDDSSLLKDGLKMALSRLELRLLILLTNSIGETLDKKKIIKYVWTSEEYSKNQDTELYVLVHRLRKKIEDNCNEPRFLIKVCGQGYLLKADNLNAYVSNNSNRF